MLSGPESCTDPGGGPPGLRGLLGSGPSREAPPSGGACGFCRVRSGGGESQAGQNGSLEDWEGTRLPGVAAAGEEHGRVWGAGWSLLSFFPDERGDSPSLF